MPTLLLVEDEAVLARHLVTILGHAGYDVRHAGSVETAQHTAAATLVADLHQRRQRNEQSDSFPSCY